MKQETMGWQWDHQRDHMLIIFTSQQTDITMPETHHLIFTEQMLILTPNHSIKALKANIKAHR